MTRHIEKSHAGRVTITAARGLVIYDENGAALASIDGNSALFVRMARECLNVAAEKGQS